MKKVINLSGGKDSTCMFLMMLEKGVPFDEVVFCDTGMEFPQLYEHLDKLEKNTGVKITRLKSDRSFEDYFLNYKRAERSLYKDIKGLGWPATVRRWCTSYLKIDIINRYFKREREREHLDYIGIAYDEPKRITNNPLKKYPLYEWKITEKDALEYCYSKGYDWGGLYKNHKRVSCWICPLQRIEDWRILRKDFPDLWQYALKLDRLSPMTLKPDYTLTDLDIRFKLEDEGVIKDARGWKDVVHNYIRDNNIEVSAAERIFILDKKMGGGIKDMLYKYKYGEFWDENNVKI